MNIELNHHGVKGQRWGVRKKNTTNTRRKSRGLHTSVSTYMQTGERFLKQIAPSMTGIAVRTVVSTTPAVALAPVFATAAAVTTRMVMDSINEQKGK